MLLSTIIFAAGIAVQAGSPRPEKSSSAIPGPVRFSVFRRQDIGPSVAIPEGECRHCEERSDEAIQRNHHDLTFDFRKAKLLFN
jgi:hypothetical protein